MKNIAVILAGGTGSRMGSETPKQFLPLGGHCVLFHSVKPFEGSPSIDEVAIVTHRDHRGRVEALVLEEMQRVLPLSVPLVADSGFGANWLEAH